MKMCFQMMVENGYPPSFAYAKAIRSLRSVIDVMDDVGIEEYVQPPMQPHRGIRDPHAWAAGDQSKTRFAKSSRETERGEFARDWMQEWSLGMPTLHRMRRTAAASDMEKTGETWRREFGK